MATVLDSSILIRAFRERELDKLASAFEHDEVITCDIVRVEIASGVFALKNEAKRERQLAWYREFVEVVASRSMDWELCERAIELAARARRNGYQVKIDDAFVGATAAEIGAKVATSNVEHFRQLGLEAFDPLEA